MLHQIKKMYSEDMMNLFGEMKIDESFFGGNDRNRHVGKRRGLPKPIR